MHYPHSTRSRILQSRHWVMWIRACWLWISISLQGNNFFIKMWGLQKVSLIKVLTSNATHRKNKRDGMCGIDGSTRLRSILYVQTLLVLIYRKHSDLTKFFMTESGLGLLLRSNATLKLSFILWKSQKGKMIMMLRRYSQSRKVAAVVYNNQVLFGLDFVGFLNWCWSSLRWAHVAVEFTVW